MKKRTKKLFLIWAIGGGPMALERIGMGFLQLNIKQIQFTDPEFEQCFQIRLEVFVQEQNVPLEEERDEYDSSSLHFLASQNGIPIGTARVILKDAGTTAKITRVAVSKSARNFGIGAALIQHIENAVGAHQFLLDAQIQALPFYLRLGYSAYGDQFIEANIPHRHMRKLRPQQEI